MTAASRVGCRLSAAALFLMLAAPLQAATVTIAWDANPEPDVAGYNVYVRVAGAPLGPATFIGNRTNWTFTNLAHGVQYVFGVQARSTSGSLSPLAEIASVTSTWIPPGSEQTRSDFNGDGWLDVLWQNRNSGQLLAWHLNGPTVTGSRFLSPAAVAAGWKMKGSGDLDFDGKPDLIWQHEVTGDLVYWLMDGVWNYSSGFFSTPRVDPRWLIASVRDMNADGSPDILWHNSASGHVLVWYLRGATVIHTAFVNPSPVADLNWKLRGTADFNRDGMNDLLWHNEATGELRVWNMNGLNAVTGENLNPAFVAPGWKIAAVGDANGDGWPDLMWQNDSSGQLVLWVMIGRHLWSAPPLSIPTVDPNWKISAPR